MNRTRSYRRRSTGLKLSRRFVLGGGATLLAATPFVPLLQADAADGAPLRMLFLYTPDGYPHQDAWTPDTSNGQFILGPSHTPLQDFSDELLLLGGVRQMRMGTDSEHYFGMAALYTGTAAQDNGAGSTNWATGPSIDQVIANAVGDETTYRSLMLAARPGQTAYASNRLHYAGNGDPVTPHKDPYALFETLFENSGIDPAELEAIRAAKKSVLDIVRDDLKGLEDYYGGAEKAKIGAHQNALRELEQQLLSDTTCESPDVGGPLDPDAAENLPELIRLQTQLAMTALSCGLTRVAGLAMASSGHSGGVYTWLGHNEIHHAMVHRPEDPAAVVAVAEVETWYAERVAHILQSLREIPEGDGTLLDNTVVVWPREMARGNGHAIHSNAWIIAGGRGAAGINSGRYIDYGDLPHPRVLTTLGNLFGLGLSSFGNLDGGGPLDDWT